VSAAPGRVASHRREPLVRGWELCAVAAGRLDNPSQLSDMAIGPWVAADVVGTAASVLRAAGAWSLDDPPRRFDAEDWWYRLRFDAPAADDGDELVLGFDGLASVAEVWLNGEPLFRSDNMFVAHEHAVHTRLRRGRNELAMRFHALDAVLQARRPRPRWRAPMIENQQLRWQRTTLLGRTPGWSPPAAAVGPWKDIWLERRTLVDVGELRVDAALDATGAGSVRVCGAIRALTARRVHAVALELARDGEVHRGSLSTGPGTAVAGTLRIAQPALWWPHTHGEPALYQARLQLTLSGCDEPVSVDLGRIGFRSLALDHGDGRFALSVNGVPVFCRGACWTPLDVVSLRATPDELRAAVAQARDAGMNMLRLSGSMVYEDDAFHDACDALGMLVWQDFMFANMDYPADDPAFAASVEREVKQQLARWRTRPSLALLCGNSEVEQQAAMWGAPRGCWQPALFHQAIARWTAESLPGVPYWPSSAHGGAFPFQGNAGSTSYYGVGAYLRPLDDARRADVRFAAECLAFANVPDDRTIARMPGGAALRVHQPAWKQRTPRDLGAGWDFEDVRDHYLALLYRVDPARTRSLDHERYLALSREVSGEVMAATFAEWRRADSNCGGALVWLLRDLWPGAGWGLLDDQGRPKPCFHHLRRALQPVGIAITDEGGNGLVVHLVNERPQPLDATLHLAAYTEDGARVGQASCPVGLPPRGAQAVAMAGLFDGFFDFSASYRFGPPPASVVVATLQGRDERLLGEAFHFPSGLPAGSDSEPGLVAMVTGRSDDTLELTLHTERFAQSVRIALDGHSAEDNHFHLAPGATRAIRLRPQGRAVAAGRGSVQALNSRRAVGFEVTR
jgi:beta-mannosidase